MPDFVHPHPVVARFPPVVGSRYLPVYGIPVGVFNRYTEVGTWDLGLLVRSEVHWLAVCRSKDLAIDTGAGDALPIAEDSLNTSNVRACRCL